MKVDKQQLKVLYLLKDKRRTVGIEALNVITGNRVIMPMRTLWDNRHNIELINAILTMSGVVRAQHGNLEIKDISDFKYGDTQFDLMDSIDNSSLLKLYYGTKNTIKSKKVTSREVRVGHYGKGVYTSNVVSVPVQELGEESKGTILEIIVDMRGLKAYEFNDVLVWALYIAYNNGAITEKYRDKVDSILKPLEKYDVIIGPAINNKIIASIKMFLNDEMTYNALKEYVVYMSYGRQYVFKTEKSLKNMRIQNSVSLDNIDLQGWLESSRRIDSSKQKEINDILMSLDEKFGVVFTDIFNKCKITYRGVQR